MGLPRVLIILNYRPNNGGITGQIEELLFNLTQEGFSIEIMSTYGSIVKRLKNIFKILIESREYDKLLGVGTTFFGFIPIVVTSIAAFIWGKPVIYNFHGGDVDKYLAKYNWFVRLTIRKNIIINASGFLHESFIKYNYSSILIPNHFNFKNLFPISNGKEFEWNKKIIWARSFYKLYQPEIILKAATKVINSDPEILFDIYGSGPLLNNLKKRYDKKGINLLGKIPRQTLLEKYQNYSMFINTTASDNFPLSIVEAGYNNLLVLSTKVGGINSIYNENQILFFSNEIDLAEKILNVFNNPCLYDNYRKNLKVKIESFTWENVRQEWLSILK